MNQTRDSSKYSDSLQTFQKARLVKLAIAGKGGVGKTLVAATLSRLLARDGYKVLAVDVDPAMNLAYALGIPADLASTIIPICENDKLIEERTGVLPESSYGAIFTLTPTVDDIAERFGVIGPEGVRLLVMGTIKSGGSGCMCPANALIRALIRHIALKRKEAVVMDMEAGLEHLGRATTKGVDALITVVEPGVQSIETAMRVKKLALDTGIKEVLAVGNKVVTDGDRKFIENLLKERDLPLLCVIPFDQAVSRADMLRIAPIDLTPTSPAITAIGELKEILRNKYGEV